MVSSSHPTVDESRSWTSLARRFPIITLRPRKPAPPAYDFALTLRTTLHSEFNRVRRELERDGCSQLLDAVQREARRGKAAINMSIPRLNRFLEGGAWLNIYELVEQETGETGGALEAEVARRIPNWYTQRKRLEDMLHLSHDTHYASLNVGGTGPGAWGSCCVILDLKQWQPYHTCFGGDTVRAGFDSNAEMVLTEAAMRSLFGTGSDAYRVATIKHQSFIRARQPRPAVDRIELIDVFENRDSLIELHLHGPVMAQHIQEVRMARSEVNHLWTQALTWERLNHPSTQEYEQVPHFNELVDRLTRAHITLYQI